jgi:hypothetical protein
MKASRPIKECEKKNLVKTAERAGFTSEGLRYLLGILNVAPRAMTFETYLEVLPYVNKVNAEKFNPIAKEV